MKISIITVSYNSEKTIKDTLDSVLSQSYDNYEYLIIDGKSTDKTLKIVKDYEKKFKGKLKYISEKDKGLYDAMNKGIKMSTGDIVGIINSDDILAHKNVFKKVVENIKDNDGVYSNLLMLDEDLDKPYRLFESHKVSKKLGWHMPHPTLYLKREVYGRCGLFNLDYRIAADLDFMLRILKSNIKLKYINDYFVYMRSGGASTNGLKGYYKNFKESYKVLRKNKVLFPFISNCIRTLNVYIQKLKVRSFEKKDLNSQRYVQINTVCNGSTGKIMGDIQRKANEDGYETLSIYGRRKGYSDLRCIKVGGFFSFWWHVILNTIFDTQGLHGSYFKTKKVIKILKKEMPDIIHLHNIHGYYLNYPVLFKYLSEEYTGKVYWTLHDCWAFTGHCPYFTIANCDKWKKGCYKCPNKKKYPISLVFDNSKNNYLKKKKYFTSLNNLTIITPSDWLNKLVKQSFMNKYKVITINNEIDKTIFKPTHDDSVLDKYNIPKDKKIVLGVASIWEDRKGLNDFVKLSSMLDDDYKIVLVGVSKKQAKKLPSNMIGIERTENQKELAVLYTNAHVFVNPTYEDNYPTVNLEAIACGTKVICYDTGGCSEQITKEYGIIVPVGDIEKINSEVQYEDRKSKKFSI